MLAAAWLGTAHMWIWQCLAVMVRRQHLGADPLGAG